MTERRPLGRLMLAVTVTVALAGCASGKARLSAVKMCTAAGGTYTTQTQTCDAPAMSGRKAADMCQAHGGYYDQVAQVCEVGIE